MADTIKTGTMLIEEGALLPESVRSESEPWTSFYMAGVIIRELRKAHENEQVSVPATKDDMRKAALRTTSYKDWVQRKHLTARLPLNNVPL